MTKEQVIAMAREAEIEWDDVEGFSEYRVSASEFERFATLVRNAAVIEERNALAELCDAMGSPNIAEYLRAQAEIIRAMKEPTT